MSHTSETYVLEGISIGRCGCQVSLSCLCWGQNQSKTTCESLVAYHITRGMIRGVDVSMLSLVRIVAEPDSQSLIYVDAQGDATQRELLIQAFTGELGGILKDIQEILPKPSLIKIAPIQFLQESHQRSTLQIGGVMVQKQVKQKSFQFKA